MDSAAFLRSLEDGLRPQVEAAGGRLDVAGDPEEVIELLAAAAPKGWRVILSFGGDEAVDPDASPGIVRWNLQSTVQAARGLRLQSGASTHRENHAGRDPLLTLAALTSRWVRGFSGSHQDLHKHGFRHVSKQWLVIEGIPTRQLMLTHRCILALDEPIDTPCTF